MKKSNEQTKCLKRCRQAVPFLLQKLNELFGEGLQCTEKFNPEKNRYILSLYNKELTNEENWDALSAFNKWRKDKSIHIPDEFIVSIDDDPEFPYKFSEFLVKDAHFKMSKKVFESIPDSHPPKPAIFKSLKALDAYKHEHHIFHDETLEDPQFR